MLGTGGTDSVVVSQRSVDDAVLDLSTLAHFRQQSGFQCGRHRLVDHFHRSQCSNLWPGIAKFVHEFNCVGSQSHLGFKIGSRNHGRIGQTQEFMVGGDLKKCEMREYISFAKSVFLIQNPAQENRGRNVTLHQDIGFFIADHFHGNLHRIGIYRLMDDFHPFQAQLEFFSN